MSKQKIKIFRTLTEEEGESFKQWARDNYEPFSVIQGYWHPVVQRECAEINLDADSTPAGCENFSAPTSDHGPGPGSNFDFEEEQEEECTLEHHTGDGKYNPFLSNL